MRERDPLVAWPAVMIEKGLMSDQQKEEVDIEIERSLASAIDYARNSPTHVEKSATMGSPKVGKPKPTGFVPPVGPPRRPKAPRAHGVSGGAPPAMHTSPRRAALSG